MIDNVAACFRNAVVTLGNFDGMHLGHMRLIAALTRRASELGAPALVYTFDEHPKNVLESAGSVKFLTDADKKRELLAVAAVDGIFFEHFDKNFASLAPEDFVKSVLVDKFNVRLVVVGSDFKFGRRGSGDIGALQEYGEKYGFSVEEVQPVYINGEKREGRAIISSSCIRDLIVSGRVDRAALLLGRLYSLKCGAASFTAARGLPGAAAAVLRPGANMLAPSAGTFAPFAGTFAPSAGTLAPSARMLAPCAGIYITTTRVAGAMHRGIAQVANEAGACAGSADIVPTMTNYLYDYKNIGDLHGAEIEIFFYKMLRGADEPDFDINGTDEPGFDLNGAAVTRLRDCAGAARQYFVVSN